MNSVQTTPPVSSPPVADDSSAAREAARNWEANLKALTLSQTALPSVLKSHPLPVTWIYGRDGSLTAIDDGGHWWAECSVPRRAGQLLLKTLEQRGATGCFLHPTHGTQVATALEMLRPDQAIIVIVPPLAELAVMLHCNDFAAEVASHRLWFASGTDWAEQLGAILREQSGLTPPQQFIRTSLLAEESSAELIRVAQAVFSNDAERRTWLAAEHRAALTVKTGRWCVIAASRFRLWDDADTILAETITGTGQSVVRLDPDDPASTSSLLLAETAAQCDVILAANRTRADLPDVIHHDRPLVTWLTRPAIRSHASAGPRDMLLLADPQWVELARKAGWPANRLHVAGWPRRDIKPGGSHLAIIADTTPLAPAPPAFDLSTHGLLWEAIGREMGPDPFVVQDAQAYLSSRMARAGITEHGLDRRRFIGDLILPAYQQGLARTILQAGLPLRLHGHGWDQIPQFAAHSAGPVTCRGDLESAAEGAAALLAVWPEIHAHSIDALGKLVVQAGRGRAEFLKAARGAIGGSAPCAGATHEIPPLTAGLLSDCIASL